MSFKPYTEKLRRKKLEFCSILGRIRIRIRIRIQNQTRIRIHHPGNGSSDPDPDPDPHQNDTDPKHCIHQCFLFSFLFINALVDECYFNAFLYFLNFFKRRAEFSQFKMLNLKSLKKLKKKHYILILYLYYFLKMKTR